MQLSDFKFELPEALIAQTPLQDRTASRLMVLDKHSGETTHRHFRDIVDYLRSGDCLVLNNTRVMPARLIGEKEGSGGAMEFMLLRRKTADIWEVMVRPGKKAKPGARFLFGGGVLKAEVLDIVEEGNRLVRFEYDGVFEQILDQVGQMPLPPYIIEKLEDKERYQTVFAKHRGSAAAPTAGLHFTGELLDKISEKGVRIVYVTLHVGLGTFRPVKADNILEHHMHAEHYRMDADSAAILNQTKAEGGRIVAVGTTACRVLETVTDDAGVVHEGSGDTSIFIYPGYQYKAVNMLVTNFHLPESTLIMLVSALAGRENVLRAYEEAVHESYRFFSFGDAMLICE